MYSERFFYPASHLPFAQLAVWADMGKAMCGVDRHLRLAPVIRFPPFHGHRSASSTYNSRVDRYEAFYRLPCENYEVTMVFRTTPRTVE